MVSTPYDRQIGSFPQVGDENETYLKPPPSNGRIRKTITLKKLKSKIPL